MAATTTRAPRAPHLEALLAATRATHRAEAMAAARKFELAVQWADAHPGDEVDTEILWEERDLEIAGDGAPTVAEFAIAEFALSIGISTDSGVKYVGDAVETYYRLPRLWKRVVAGAVPVWKARRIAQATRSLPMDAADHVDQHLAPVAERCSFAQLDRTVEAARAAYDPEEAEARAAQAAEPRHFEIRVADVGVAGPAGVAYVEGCLDLADALALEAAIAARASQLAVTHPELSLNVRRSMAAGQLGISGNGSGSGSGTRREVVVYTHHRPDTPDGLVEVDNTGSLAAFDQLWEWCTTAGTKVTVKPVIDLNTALSTDDYEPSAALREQVVLTHPRWNLGSHATPWLVAVLASISSSTSAGVRNPCRLRGRELSSAAMLSSMPGP